MLVVIALAIASVFACNSNGNGMPDCNTVAAGRYRNFWDPTAYWVCAGKSAATSRRCEDDYGAQRTMYDSAKDECVNWADWVWTPPCA